MALHEIEVQPEERGRERGQDRDVNPVEARQRRAGHVLAAAQQPAAANSPTTGSAPGISVPTLVAKNDSSFHGSR